MSKFKVGQWVTVVKDLPDYAITRGSLYRITDVVTYDKTIYYGIGRANGKRINPYWQEVLFTQADPQRPWRYEE